MLGPGGTFLVDVLRPDDFRNALGDAMAPSEPRPPRWQGVPSTVLARAVSRAVGAIVFVRMPPAPATMRGMRRTARWQALAVVLFAGAMAMTSDAAAFTHVVQKGETLAGVAERYYGRIHYERILVHANALDACGGFPIVAGMRLEIPAVSHHRVLAGETWQTLARDYLGDPHRAEVLASANDAKSWVAPEDGADIVIPYNLRFIVEKRETAPSIAKRFFADRESAWMLDRYNGIDGKALRRGDVVLVPLTDLPLTKEGEGAARASEASVRSQGGGSAREAQRTVAGELPLLLAELRGGHYLEATVRANRLLALGDLTVPQVADIHRVLTEAYVALDATGLAAASCQKWLEADPEAELNPIDMSPKILAACKSGQATTEGANAG